MLLFLGSDQLANPVVTLTVSALVGRRPHGSDPDAGFPRLVTGSRLGKRGPECQTSPKFREARFRTTSGSGELAPINECDATYQKPGEG